MTTKRSRKGLQSDTPPASNTEQHLRTSAADDSAGIEESSREETLRHVLFTANSAINVCQSACSKRGKDEPVLTSLGTLTIVLQSPGHPVPVFYEDDNSHDLFRKSFGVVVWDGPRAVLNVQWDYGHKYTVPIFEPGDWMEVVNNAAHPSHGNDGNE
ncbi:MAG: hypothetical protein EPO08_16500 [Rhodospirillaceae bacterium]|nr:MAG: hypothetical protein EPO08_16500 [Rhodospirillaceae bacterium]